MQSLHPVSLYGLTKKFNEDLAENYFNLFGFKSIGLRFFTVYGPWGRPDMAYFKFSELIRNSKEIIVYNQGKMSRDMTFVDDVCDGILSSINYEAKKNEIFICIIKHWWNTPHSLQVEAQIQLMMHFVL